MIMKIILNFDKTFFFFSLLRTNIKITCCEHNGILLHYSFAVV